MTSTAAQRKSGWRPAGWPPAGSAPARGLRVLHLGFEDDRMPWSGGGSLRTWEINRRLAAAGMQITVLTTRYPSCRDEVRDGVRYLHVGIGRGSNRLTRLLGYLVMAPVIGRRLADDVDLVVEDFFPPFSSMAVPLWTRHRPVLGMVQWLQAREKAREYKLPFHLLQRLTVRTHRRLITVSAGTAGQLAKLSPAATVRVIGNGVDRGLFDEPAQLGRDVLFIGRLEQTHKGLDLLLSAWQQAQDRIDGDLVIVGRGPDEAGVRQLAQRLGVSERVRFAGWASGAEKARMLSSARVVVVPSRAETFGIVAVEALAAGTPVVAFDIPSLREVVQEDCGVRVPAFDVAALATELAGLYDDPARVLACGRAGRAFARRYDWDALAREQAEVYRSAAEGGWSR